MGDLGEIGAGITGNCFLPFAFLGAGAAGAAAAFRVVATLRIRGFATGPAGLRWEPAFVAEGLPVITGCFGLDVFCAVFAVAVFFLRNFVISFATRFTRDGFFDFSAMTLPPCSDR
jgi:hypothetical protein